MTVQFHAYYRLKEEDADESKKKPIFHHDDFDTMEEAIAFLRDGRDAETHVPVCIQDSNDVVVMDGSQVRRI